RAARHDRSPVTETPQTENAAGSQSRQLAALSIPSDRQLSAKDDRTNGRRGVPGWLGRRESSPRESAAARIVECDPTTASATADDDRPGACWGGGGVFSPAHPSAGGEGACGRKNA